MKYKTLFRLLLKVIGVWIFSTGIGGAAQMLAYMIQSMTSTYSGQTIFFAQYAYNMIGPGAQMALGLYLFFGGRWLADLAIPGNRLYCHECGYDLTGAIGGICNECGTPFGAADQANQRAQ